MRSKSTLSKEEFESLPKQKIAKLITLNHQRKAIIDEWFFNENLTDDEYIEFCQPIYLEQAMEDGIVK